MKRADPVPLRYRGERSDTPSLLPLSAAERGRGGEVLLNAISTDTRRITPGALFVALRGETHDGHDYLQAAADAGATAFVVDRALTDSEPRLPYILVPDTLHALGDIARLVRNDFKGPVVAITGSVGKTTTKEMIADVLGTTFHVHKSAANFNNEIGVPQTIFALDDTHTALVVEMGMRGLGEIRRLCEIAAPTIGVITNIGSSHIERLGSREAIAQAKGELFESLPADGVAIYPADDDFAVVLAAKFGGRKVAVGTDVSATEVTRHENGYRFTVTTPDSRPTKFFLPSPGAFNVQNALLTIAVGDVLGVPLDISARALLRWKAPAMRLEIVTGANGCTILSDAYNAAPDSMVGALKTLRETPVKDGGNRIAVLGEMRELGAHSAEGHTLVGRAAATLAKPDMLVVVGADDARKIAAGAIAEKFDTGNIHYFDTADDAAKILPFIVTGADVVLVKGSRAMAMEKIVVALGGEAGEPPAGTSPVRGETSPPAPLSAAERGSTEGGTGIASLPRERSDTPSSLLLSSEERGAGGEVSGDSLSAFLDRERAAGFPALAGADLSLAVPITQTVLNDLLAFGLAAAPPIDGVSDISVRFAGNDLLAAQATIEKWVFKKTILVEARVERHVPFATNPVLTLTLLTRGVIEMILNVVPLPKWVSIDGSTIKVNLRDILRENGAEEWARFVHELNIFVKPGVAHLTAKITIAEKAA